MRLHFDHHEFPARHDLPADLQRIDDALADLAAIEQTPAGLTDRIYDASVSALPGRLRFRGRTIAQPQHRARFHRPVWGQLAMAASIGLAFVVAAWFLAVPGGVSERGSSLIAEHTEAPVVRTVAYRTAAPLTPDAEWLLLDSGFNGRASHLIDTRDLTFAQLRSESERLLDELEL